MPGIHCSYMRVIISVNFCGSASNDVDVNHVELFTTRVHVQSRYGSVPFNLLVPFVSGSSVYQACGITIQSFLTEAKAGTQDQRDAASYCCVARQPPAIYLLRLQETDREPGKSSGCVASLSSLPTSTFLPTTDDFRAVRSNLLSCEQNFDRVSG